MFAQATQTQFFKVRRFLISFYLVGLAGFVLPYTQDFFKLLTPYAILLNIAIMAYFHPRPYSYKVLLTYLLIYCLGFGIEVVGVQTGIIFGAYAYGSGLGPKLWATPLLIGLNWLMLTYASTCLLNKYAFTNWQKILAGAALMLLYDLILEQLAPHLDMWQFEQSPVPLQNYLAWFVVALVMHLLISKFRHNNPLAASIFLLQTAFFILLIGYFSFV